MSKGSIAIHDKAVARLLSAGSTAAQHFPRLRDIVSGFDNPAYTPVRWRYNGMSQDEVTNWIEIAGRKDHGRTPRNYKEVGLLAVHRQEMAKLQLISGIGQAAVAYSLGEAVMVGVLPKGRDFAQENDDVVVGMRIGQGVLRASMGNWYESAQIYQPTHDPVRLLARVNVQDVSVDTPVV